MRCVMNFNKDWHFERDIKDVPTSIRERAETVNLPHTWNAEDGQDGGNDYMRAKCAYIKQFSISDLPEGEEHYLEINGANLKSEVWLNGDRLAEHIGGYSTWRVNLTSYLCDDNLLVITVDNSNISHAYPAVADFTFYGGLYRTVNIIAVPKVHFDLDYYGAPGIKITPDETKNFTRVGVEAFLNAKNPDLRLEFSIFDKNGALVARKRTSADDTTATLEISSPHLWHGRRDPYLYTAQVLLTDGDVLLDSVSARFGCRSFYVDAERGFFLNGEAYPLRGVSRHQDRKGIGNALLNEHHREDMELIRELGATTIRLAHYQHDQYFYDLCDEAGIVVWAEIPYISHHVPEGRANTVSQMTELIVQNYNHPSICFWGLSNEITMSGAGDPDLIENHKMLNDLAHEMDKTRLTTVACVSMCDIHEEYLHIPDLVAYNHYFGWYGGDTSMNGPWFDNFHREYPNTPIGVSEYGCEALDWHTSDPTQGDYTEEYQAYYHEELIKQLFTRPYIWATYVWNMFDFGADARCEGGENGQNHKGLVTFDRKYRKDAFYAYKAWLSDEPFVHICSKQYVDRVEPVSKIKVYSNLPAVELFVDGMSVGIKESKDHFFTFEIENKGEQAIAVIAGECKDEARIRKVDEFNEKYRLKETGTVLNWFDITMPNGKLSINDKIETILITESGREIFREITDKISHGSGEGGFGGAMANENMMQMLGGFTLLRFTGLVGMMNVEFSKEELLNLNSRLNTIDKPC